MKKQIEPIKFILIFAFLLCLLGVVGLAGYQAGKAASTSGAVAVENIFVDLNGDGRPDLLLAGQAVLNVGGPLSPTSQPKPVK